MLQNLMVMLIIIVIIVSVLRKVERNVVVRQNVSDSSILLWIFSSRCVNMNSKSCFIKQIFVIMNISRSSIFRLLVILFCMCVGLVMLISSVLIVSRLFGSSGQYFSVMVRVKINLIISSQLVINGVMVNISGFMIKKMINVSLYQFGDWLRKLCYSVWL